MQKGLAKSFSRSPWIEKLNFPFPFSKNEVNVYYLKSSPYFAEIPINVKVKVDYERPTRLHLTYRYFFKSEWEKGDIFILQPFSITLF